MVVAPVRRKWSTIATARADPSSGSVPVPTSSIRSRAGGRTDLDISEMFRIWAVKVERFAAIDC
jgi:hypothetical protein